MENLNNNEEIYNSSYDSRIINEIIQIDSEDTDFDDIIPLLPNKTSDNTQEDLKEFNDILKRYYKQDIKDECNKTDEIFLLDLSTSNSFINTENECNKLEYIDNEVLKLDEELLIPATTIFKPKIKRICTNDTNLRAFRKPNTTVANLKYHETDNNMEPIKNEKVFFLDQLKNENIISNSNNGNDYILISSEEDSDCSYHSSDFEFIDEIEAKKIGFIKKEIEKAKDIKPRDIDYYFLPENDEVHRVPEGNDFVSLFAGRYTPLPTNCMENKAVSTGLAMETQFGGIGFDMRMCMKRKENEELRDAALESEKKIYSLYPAENRRMRRRRH